MSDDHRFAVDDGVAERFGLGVHALMDPDRGQSERRLGRGDALQLADGIAGVHRQQMAGHDLAARDLRAAHLEHVLVRVEVDLVVYPHPRDHHAEVAGDLAPDHRHALRERAAGAPVDQRHQPEADTELQRVDRQLLQHRVARDLVAGGQLGRLGRLRLEREQRVRQAMPVHAAPDHDEAPPMSRNGIFGRPGTSAKAVMTQPATIVAFVCERICLAISEPRSRSEAVRVTMMPVATEISSAGICAARPSPTVRIEYVLIVSPKLRCRCSRPIDDAADQVDAGDQHGAVASPRTNFEAPSMAP